jgi:hypothetical protein
MMEKIILPNFALARLQNIHAIIKLTEKHILVSCVDIYIDSTTNAIPIICGIFEDINGKKYFNEELAFINNEYTHN